MNLTIWDLSAPSAYKGDMMTKYDYKPGNKKILIPEAGKGKPILLLDPKTFKRLGEMRMLRGKALQDFENAQDNFLTPGDDPAIQGP